MPDTTEKKTPTRTRKPKPETELTPERDFDAEFVERVKSDLTFRSETTEAQQEGWKWVKAQFQGFRHRVFSLLESTALPARFTATDEFVLYKFSLREAERFANAAIARDSKPDWAISGNEITSLYPIDLATAEAKLGKHTEQQRLCFEISRNVYELGVMIAEELPKGRALSVFATEMEVVRGWLIDCINNNADRDPRRGRTKTFFNIENITP